MNRKLIKTIASITCGLGIVFSIPFMATSCGSENGHDIPHDIIVSRQEHGYVTTHSLSKDDPTEGYVDLEFSESCQYKVNDINLEKFSVDWIFTNFRFLGDESKDLPDIVKSFALHYDSWKSNKDKWYFNLEIKENNQLNINFYAIPYYLSPFLGDFMPEEYRSIDSNDKNSAKLDITFYDLKNDKPHKLSYELVKDYFYVDYLAPFYISVTC